MLSAGVTFTNDRYPRATTPDLSQLRGSEPDEETLPTFVRVGTTVGARAVIGPGIELGRFSMVGMGAVVTRSVPDFHLVAGFPARTIAAVGREGHPIARAVDGLLPDGDVICPRTGASYRIEDQRVVERDVEVGRWVGRRWLAAACSGSPWRGSSAGVGDEVTVFEASIEIGGLAAPWRIGDTVWDRHYHVTLESDTRTRELLDWVDLDDEIEWHTTKTGFYAGQTYGLRSATTPWELFRLAVTQPARHGADRRHRHAGLPSGRRRARSEDIPVADWLRKQSGGRAFDRFWVPLLRAKLGSAWTDTSAAFIWSTMRRLDQGPAQRPRRGTLRLRTRWRRPHLRSARHRS